MSIADLRKEYARESLTERDVDPDPIRQFMRWFDQARAAELLEPNAMALATATPEGHPSVRMVLLKAVDDRGFVDRKSTRLNSSHSQQSRMPSSA